MFALPAGLQLGWLIYERARALTGAASHISGWINLLLSDVDSEVRLLLEQLVHRVDALTPALTFALTWSSDKGSCVSDVVFQAKAELFRIEQFIHQCTQQRGQVKLLDREWLIRHLQSHLRELEFNIGAVNLAVSLIAASRSSQPHSSVVSASALLRASDRLQSMHETGGDVTISFGALYAINTTQPKPTTQGTEAERGGRGGSEGGAGVDVWHRVVGSGGRVVERTEDAELTSYRSQIPLNASTFLTNYDHFSADPEKKGGEQERGKREESGDEKEAGLISPSAPVHSSAGLTSPPSSTSTHSSSPVSDFSSVTPVCDMRTSLNTSIIDASEEKDDEEERVKDEVDESKASPHPHSHPLPSTNKPQPTSAWERIWPAAALKIYRNTARNVYELHVENLAADPALVDGDLLSSPSLSSSSARRLRFDLTSSLNFRCSTSAMLHLKEDETAKSHQSGLLDVCFTWCDQWVQRVQRQFAFMLLDLDVATHGRQADTLRPLDIAYAARLCCYENASQPKTKIHQQKTSGLYHVQATDEELWLLFGGVTYEVKDEQQPQQEKERSGQSNCSTSNSSSSPPPSVPCHLSSIPAPLLTVPTASPVQRRPPSLELTFSPTDSSSSSSSFVLSPSPRTASPVLDGILTSVTYDVHDPLFPTLVDDPSSHELSSALPPSPPLHSHPLATSFSDLPHFTKRASRTGLRAASLTVHDPHPPPPPPPQPLNEDQPSQDGTDGARHSSGE